MIQTFLVPTPPVPTVPVCMVASPSLTDQFLSRSPMTSSPGCVLSRSITSACWHELTMPSRHCLPGPCSVAPAPLCFSGAGPTRCALPPHPPHSRGLDVEKLGSWAGAACVAGSRPGDGDNGHFPSGPSWELGGAGVADFSASSSASSTASLTLPRACWGSLVGFGLC